MNRFYIWVQNRILSSDNESGVCKFESKYVLSREDDTSHWSYVQDGKLVPVEPSQVPGEFKVRLLLEGIPC